MILHKNFIEKVIDNIKTKLFSIQHFDVKSTPDELTYKNDFKRQNIHKMDDFQQQLDRILLHTNYKCKSCR